MSVCAPAKARQARHGRARARATDFDVGPFTATIPFSTSHHPVFHPQGKLSLANIVTIVIANTRISRTTYTAAVSINKIDPAVASQHLVSPFARRSLSRKYICPSHGTSIDNRPKEQQYAVIIFDSKQEHCLASSIETIGWIGIRDGMHAATRSQ